MGEASVSDRPDDVLVSIGLGSCIGLVLVEAGCARAGLAHVMLPEAPKEQADVAQAKYADLAVPHLADAMVAMGASPSRLQAVLVGGAQMLSFGKDASLSIGARNERAVRSALDGAGLVVRASATLGERGRTVRVSVGSGLVTVKEAGGPESLLYSWRATA